MTIPQQTDYIISHPAFIHAINELHNGNKKEFQQLLNDYASHVYIRCAETAPRVYKSVHKENVVVIVDKLSRMDVPSLDLKLRMPIVTQRVVLKEHEPLSLKTGKPIKKKENVVVSKLKQLGEQLMFPFITMV